MPASQSADMDAGAKVLSPLLRSVRELLRTMDAEFDDIQAKFDAFKPNPKLELNQLGMAQLLKTTMPSLSTVRAWSMLAARPSARVLSESWTQTRVFFFR